MKRDFNPRDWRSYAAIDVSTNGSDGARGASGGRRALLCMATKQRAIAAAPNDLPD
jgi:hypothetical protein